MNAKPNLQAPFHTQESEAEAIEARVAGWRIRAKTARFIPHADKTLKRLSLLIAEGEKAALILRSPHVIDSDNSQHGDGKR